MIASIAIGVAATLAVTMLISVAANRRTAERLLVATEELSNQLELLTARPWSALTADAVRQVRLSEMAAASLPNGELRIALHEVSQPALAKRLDAEIRWQDRAQAVRPPLRMSAWVFAVKGNP